MSSQVCFISVIAGVIMGVLTIGGMYFKLDAMDTRLERLENKIETMITNNRLNKLENM